MSEIELKLEVDPKNLLRIKSLPWLSRMMVEAATTRHLRSVYHDTNTLRIHAHGFSLRVRSDGASHVQTVKSEGSFVRGEREDKIDGQTPEWRFAKKSLPQVIGRKRFRRSIKPLFVTEVERDTSILSHRNTTIEFSIDQGVIKSGDKTEAINEIEFEVKDGDPTTVIGIARRLADEIPVRYGFRSKAERGYDLLKPKHPVYAEPITFPRDATTGEAFKVIARACLHHFAANDHAVEHGNPDGIHQMRVGIRRLRAALSIFKPMVLDTDIALIESNLKWLLSQLGNARDTDVFLRETIVPLMKEKQRKDFSILKTDLEGQRSAAFLTASQAVQTDRYHRLVLQTALWIEGGRWVHSTEPQCVELRDGLMGDFACDVLDERATKVIKKLKKLKTLSPEKRHKLRIATKKLRYAVEFFGSLFFEVLHTAYASHLKAIQDALGQLNDIAVHERLSERFVHSETGLKGRQIAFAIGFVTGREQTAASHLTRAAVKAGKQLRNAPRFWT